MVKLNTGLMRSKDKQRPSNSDLKDSEKAYYYSIKNDMIVY